MPQTAFRIMATSNAHLAATTSTVCPQDAYVGHEPTRGVSGSAPQAILPDSPTDPTPAYIFNCPCDRSSGLLFFFFFSSRHNFVCLETFGF